MDTNSLIFSFFNFSQLQPRPDDLLGPLRLRRQPAGRRSGARAAPSPGRRLGVGGGGGLLPLQPGPGRDRLLLRSPPATPGGVLRAGVGAGAGVGGVAAGRGIPGAKDIKKKKYSILPDFEVAGNKQGGNMGMLNFAKKGDERKIKY